MSTTFFVTGANRGVGLGLVQKILADKSHFVIATARNVEKATDLKKLADETKRVKIIKLDISDAKSIETIDDSLKGVDKIDVFVSNAAIGSSFQTVLNTDYDKYLEHYKVNVLGPILVFKKLYKYMKTSSTKKLLFLTSLAASIGGMIPIPMSAYGSSKAGLNYIVKELSLELGPEGFTSFAVHPGAVDTDMGAVAMDQMKETAQKFGIPMSLVSVEHSANDVYNVIMKPAEEVNGKLISNDGSEYPF